MTAKKPEIKRRGKPLGTRQKEGLYTDILGILQKDKDQKGKNGKESDPWDIPAFLRRRKR